MLTWNNRTTCFSISLIIFITSSLPAISQQVEYFSPRQGAQFVSPKTNIIIRPGEILDRSSVRTSMLLNVTGSISGRHAGMADISDDERTFLFQPDSDFIPGEFVRVELLRGLKTAKGSEIYPFSFSFTITPNVPVSRKNAFAISGHEKSTGMREAVMTPGMSNQTAPHKQQSNFPPDFPSFHLNIINNPAPGVIVLSVQTPVGISNPIAIPFLVIIGDSGQMVFCRQMEQWCDDFKMQSNGLLTYFDPVPEYFYAMDSSYAVVDSFKCGNGYTTDLHDLQLLPNNHALLMGLDQETVDMSQIVEGGLKNAQVTGLIIQEMDKDKRVVFEWRSWDHYKITDAMGIDLRQFAVNYVWGNSVQEDLDGNILLSCRNFSEVTKIDRQTGEIIWRLGGKNNQFVFINDSIGFLNQHDARRLPNGNMTIFDNGDLIRKPYSRAVEYKLDEVNKTAELVWQYQNNPGIQSAVCGNVQRLPNGNTVIGWGNANKTTMTELHPDGTKALELNFQDDFVYSYRVFKYPWKTTTAVTERGSGTFLLGQNYPNPLTKNRSLATIQYSLYSRGHVQLKLFDLFGREIQSLVDEIADAGAHTISFDAQHLSPGLYFYRITTPAYTRTRSMLITK